MFAQLVADTVADMVEPELLVPVEPRNLSLRTGYRFPAFPFESELNRMSSELTGLDRLASYLTGIDRAFSTNEPYRFDQRS